MQEGLWRVMMDYVDEWRCGGDGRRDGGRSGLRAWVVEEEDLAWWQPFFSSFPLLHQDQDQGNTLQFGVQ